MRKFNLFIACIAITICSIAQNKTPENRTDEKGRKQGLWLKKDEKGNKLFLGEFKDDKPIGIMKQYFKGSDSLKALLNYRKDGSVNAVLFYESNSKKNAEGKYWNEKKDSTWQFYDESGKLISIEQYKKGLKDGISKVYFPNGKVSEEQTFLNDKKQGVGKKYYDSGEVKSEQNFVLGNLHGLSATYYPNKVEAARGYYKNGVKNHVWIYKKQDGSIESKAYWWEGIEVKEADYLRLKASTTDNKEEVEIIKPINKIKKETKGKKP